LLKDSKRIEGVQRFTKLNKEKAYNLPSRRLKLDSPTLEFRRNRCDIIQTFKIIKEYDLVDSAKFSH